MRTELESRISPEPTSGCWLWASTYDSFGYGVLRNKKAHRLSWQAYRGEIPDGMFVCHKCDVPECINPDHLFLGTPRENAQDMVRKGRHVGRQFGRLDREHFDNEIRVYLRDEGLEAIKSAAEVEVLSVSKFVMMAAVKEAKRVLRGAK
jgi:hypothetical protein